MTRSLERRTSAIAHAKKAQAGVESLARRPQVLEPAVGDDPTLYAMTQWFGLHSAADDTPYDLIDIDGTGVDGEWVLGYSSDVDQIEVDLTNGEITVLDPPGGGIQDQGGIWIATLKVFYDDQFTGDMWTAVNWNSWSTDIDVDLQYQKAQGANTHVFGETGICTSMQLVYDAVPASNPSLKGFFWQVSGAAQDVFMILFTVCRVSRYPGANGAFFP